MKNLSKIGLMAFIFSFLLSIPIMVILSIGEGGTPGGGGINCEKQRELLKGKIRDIEGRLATKIESLKSLKAKVDAAQKEKADLERLKEKAAQLAQELRQKIAACIAAVNSRNCSGFDKSRCSNSSNLNPVIVQLCNTAKEYCKANPSNDLCKFCDSYLKGGGGLDVVCDANNRCPQGQECYKFPDKTNPICWIGNPCARCASGKCIVSESYPAQVQCISSGTNCTPLAIPQELCTTQCYSQCGISCVEHLQDKQKSDCLNKCLANCRKSGKEPREPEEKCKAVTCDPGCVPTADGCGCHCAPDLCRWLGGPACQQYCENNPARCAENPRQYCIENCSTPEQLRTPECNGCR